MKRRFKQPQFNSDTAVCISIAAKPGNFGAAFHNAAYQALGINWIYIPCKVENFSKLEAAINAVRALGIKGCGVSMPYKEKVIQYLDALDSSAKRTGCVNTIKRLKGGFLKGYNTDFYGAKKALEQAGISGREVLMIGAGGAARAIGLAVKELGGRLTIVNRTYGKAEELGRQLKAAVLPWEEIAGARGRLLINATSVGMRDPMTMVVPKEVIAGFEVVKDAVIYPKQTRLLREAQRMGKEIIPGTLMCAYQAARQFNIYTGLAAPGELIARMLRWEN
ncbi:MAG: shikimate dehydrogenase [Candidatus Omnitrophota bacterium]